MIALTQEKREELVSRLKIYIRTTETAVKARLATEEDLFNLEVRKIALASLKSETIGWGLRRTDGDKGYGNWLTSLPRKQGYLDCQPHAYENVPLFAAPPVPYIKRPDLLDIPDGLDLSSAMAAINWYEMETKRLNGWEE